MRKIVLLALVFASCKKSDAPQTSVPCDPNISYSSRVKPVFVANCTASGCHDGGNLPSLADYTTAHDASAQIRDAVSRVIMPMNGTLSTADKAAIVCWVDSGSKNN